MTRDLVELLDLHIKNIAVSSWPVAHQQAAALMVVAEEVGRLADAVETLASVAVGYANREIGGDW